MKYEFFTGSYAPEGKPGIIRFRLDSEKTTLEELYHCSRTGEPSYLCLNKTKSILYAVQEQFPEGSVHEFLISENGLSHRKTLSSGGAHPCHLSMSSEMDALYAANYSSGSLSVYRLDEDGALISQSDFHQHSGKGANPIRQEAAHVHFSMEHEGILYVADLGQDQVFLYKKGPGAGTLVDTGRRLSIPAGFGPRHLAFDPARPEMVYVLCELAGKVVVFKKDGDEHTMVQIADTLPADFQGENISAAVKCSGRLLFASNRGHDSIAVFRIQEDGSLKRTGIFPSGGKAPRDFDIFGDLLVVANQDSDSLTVLALDREEGTLSLTDLQANLYKPCCICPCR